MSSVVRLRGSPVVVDRSTSLSERARPLPGFPAERIVQRAEAAVAALKSEYRAALGSSLRALATSYREASGRPGDNRSSLRALEAGAFDLKGPGGTFGYPLISRIGDSLASFLSGRHEAGPRELALIGLHLDALMRVARDNVEGDGGPIGRELLASLERARAKLAGP